MSVTQFIRTFVPLATGLAIGAVGAVLFLQSMPGEKGSPEERAAKLEVELKRATNKLAALEAADPQARRRTGRTLADGARSIAEDMHDGRPVSPDDIFRASQPLLRDLAPLFDRIRLRQQQESIDRMTGEFTRKFDLTDRQRDALKRFFEERAEEKAREWSELVAREGTDLEDLMRAAHNARPDDGLDAFMERTLSGEKLSEFRNERMAERVARVQDDADMRVQRLDSIVGLDGPQRDQVFGIMARSSPDYDPSMGLEGAGGDIGQTPGGDRREAMLSVLRPEQVEAYEAERERRRTEAAKDLEAMGLTLPPDWQFFDELID